MWWTHVYFGGFLIKKLWFELKNLFWNFFHSIDTGLYSYYFLQIAQWMRLKMHFQFIFKWKTTTHFVGIIANRIESSMKRAFFFGLKKCFTFFQLTFQWVFSVFIFKSPFQSIHFEIDIGDSITFPDDVSIRTQSIFVQDKYFTQHLVRQCNYCKMLFRNILCTAFILKCHTIVLCVERQLNHRDGCNGWLDWMVGTL